MEPDTEMIEALAEKYAEQYVERFQKVAKKAYMDGIIEVLNNYLDK